MEHKAIKMSVVTKRVGKDRKSSGDCIQRHYWNTGIQEETSKEIEKTWPEEKEENQMNNIMEVMWRICFKIKGDQFIQILL